MLEVKDALTHESLHGVERIGNLPYEKQANGIISFTLPGSFSSDSIEIRYKGYQSTFLALPLSSKNLLIYLRPKSIEVKEVVVSIDQGGSYLRNATSSVEFAEAKALGMHSTSTLNQQLNLVPGVYIQSGTNSTNRLTIRGIGSRTPYSSNRVRGYLGDFPLSNGNGVTVVEDIDPELIQSVELIKGPAMSLYGSGIGGVLKLNPVNPLSGKSGVKIKSQTESFGGFLLAASAKLRKKEAGIQLYCSRYKSNGFRENNAYARNTFYLSGAVPYSSALYSLQVLYTSVNAQIPSSINFETYSNTPSQAASNWLRVAGYEQYNKLGILFGVQNFMGKRIKNKLSVGYLFANPYELRPFNILDDKQSSVFINERLYYYIKSWKFSLNINFLHEHYSWKTHEIENLQAAKIINDYTDTKTQINPGLLVRGTVWDRLIVNFGLGLNYTSYHLTNNQNDTALKYRYTPKLSPSLGVNYKAHKLINLFAAVSHGISLPSIEETLFPDGNINTALKAESGLTVESGMRFTTPNKRFNYGAAVYISELNNMLVTKRLAEDEFMGINAGKVRYSGVETQLIALPNVENLLPFAQAKISSNFQTSFNHFIHFIDNEVDYSGNILPGIPSYTFNASMQFTFFKHLELDYRFASFGKQYLADNNTLVYNGHGIHSIQLAYTLKRWQKVESRVHIRIENLSNTHYASMLLINAPAFGGNSPRYYYPGKPRNWGLGINMRF